MKRFKPFKTVFNRPGRQVGAATLEAWNPEETDAALRLYQHCAQQALCAAGGWVGPDQDSLPSQGPN